jgi:DNA-binding GntR family transcriptional regulator
LADIITATQTMIAYNKLKSDVLSCRLEAGEKLRIKDLAAEIGVSLGGVREALARLAAEEMVIATAQKGYCVADVSFDELQDITQTRVMIESECLRQSIEHMDLDGETALMAAFHRLSKLSERDKSDPEQLSAEWEQAHAAFHGTLVACCPSPWLLKLRRMLFEQSERYRRLSVPLARVKRDVNAEHKGIFDAAMARDSAEATKMMGEHLWKTARILEQSPIFETSQRADA